MYLHESLLPLIRPEAHVRTNSSIQLHVAPSCGELHINYKLKLSKTIASIL